MAINEPVQDVFISYAHADDEPLPGAKSGWVTTFVDELKKLLRRKLGGNGASVWMDHQLAENEQVTGALIDSVSRSRTLVLFMSPGYSKSTWCQKELGNFLDRNISVKNKESVFIVELDLTERETWHPRLQELTPIRFWREGPDQVPCLLGYPAPKLDQEDPYWLNLNKLAHLIADHLKTCKDLIKIHAELIPALPPTPRLVIWIAEPTDDLIDQWEALAEAIRQAGADLRPIGLDIYPRSSEAEFVASLRADLDNADAHLLVQLLSQVPGRRPANGAITFTSLQSATASNFSKQRQRAFLQWRNRDLNLESVTDENQRQLLTGAIACGFEEFRQRVLTILQNLNPSSTKVKPADPESLAICISANKADHDLGLQVRDILVELGADTFTTPTEPAPEQTPTEFNTQLDEVIGNSEGVIIVYGQTPPVWVQAQYMRTRKSLAQRHKAVWGALLDGPPSDKPDAGVAGRNIMMLPCRDGSLQPQIERFVSCLRPESHV